jgi:hypothetical protein
MDPNTGVLPGSQVMVDRATRRKFAWEQSPLAACPQEVKDGVEDGTKVGGARSPDWSRRRQNRANPGPRRVGHVGVVESSVFIVRSLWPGSALLQDDVDFSNTLSKLGAAIGSSKKKPLERRRRIAEWI